MTGKAAQLNKEDHVIPNGYNININENLSQVELSEFDVKSVLQSLDKSKAVGGDGLPTTILKN